MANDRAISILSSGLDSTVATKMAQEQGYKVIGAITFNYNQRAYDQEVKHAAMYAQYLNIPLKIINLPFVEASTSGLVNRQSKIPTPDVGDLDSFDICSETAKAVWVPNRNGVFINIGAMIAEAGNADSIIVGFNAEEGTTFPDNTLGYMQAATKGLYYSTANHVEVLSPTYNLHKREIARIAVESEIPLNCIWPCYYSKEKWCGECESCKRTIRAFKSIGGFGAIKGFIGE